MDYQTAIRVHFSICPVCDSADLIADHARYRGRPVAYLPRKIVALMAPVRGGRAIS